MKVAFGGASSTFQGDGGTEAWFLTSCGMDGVVRRWYCRGSATTTATATPAVGGSGVGAGAMGQQRQQGLMQEWRGHRGEGEGGGVLGFVLMGGGKVVTAGDDGVSLVFG